MNPNLPVEDEYIGNLQQQIHFMELELKILKEKVVDDEKKSGIGSLFDDEKTSYQHIQQLKDKYQKMRTEFDNKNEALNKHKLKVIGEQFVLNSQITIMTEQNEKINKDKESRDRENDAKIYDLKKDLEHQQKAVNDLVHHMNQMGHDNREE